MKKIRVPRYNQAIMAPLGIYSYNLTGSSNEFFTSIITYYLLFVELGFAFMGSAAFVLKHWPKFDIISQPCLFIFGATTILGLMFSFGCNMKSVKALHLKLQQIVDECKSILIFSKSQFIFWTFSS